MKFNKRDTEFVEQCLENYRDFLLDDLEPTRRGYGSLNKEERADHRKTIKRIDRIQAKIANGSEIVK